MKTVLCSASIWKFYRLLGYVAIRGDVTYFRYSSTCSVWLPQYRIVSSTPALARNSNVYSMSGVLARGSRHFAKSVYICLGNVASLLTRGRSNVRGAKVDSNGSAKTTACSGSSRSSSPFGFCPLAPFFALGGMLSVGGIGD